MLLAAPGLQAIAQKNDSAIRKPTELQEVTITAKDPVVTQEADKIIYNLEADPQSKVSSLLDMMRKVPQLSVDGEENVLLNGSSSYKIFINGRPSGLLGSNPKDVLRSMPASTIKSIEVITNPPAKYDAEGLAGIINIVTVKQTYNGYRGAANVKSTGPAGGPGAGGSFTFKQGRLGMSALAGINCYNLPETSAMLERTTGGFNPTDLQQRTTNKTRSYTAYAGSELSYEPDSLNLISGQFNLHSSLSSGRSTQASTLTDAHRLQQYYLEHKNNKNNSGLDAAVNYQRGFKANKEQALTLSYSYMNDRNSLDNDIVIYNEINYPNPDYRQYNATGIAEHAGQVDYVQPVNNLGVEGGAKGISRTNKSDFRYLNLNTSTGEYETDHTRSNIFNNRQDIFSVYNSYAYRREGWQVKAGVRAEQTMIKGSYSQGATAIRHKYLNLLPAFVANRKLNDNSSVSFSYSKRIQRPSIEEMNPFADRSNPDFEWSGNPYLRPITSNVYQLSYLVSARATLNISAGGMFLKNVFSAFSFYDPITNITYTRQENYGRGRVLKTYISLNYPISTNCDFTINSDIRHVKIDGSANGRTVKRSGVDVHIYASFAYRFTCGWRINADVTARKGGLLLSPLGRVNGFVATSFSVSKDIHSKFTVSAAISNPFTKYRYINQTVTGPDFLQESSNQSYFRRFTLSLNYRFGMLKTELKKARKGISNDDIVS